MSSILSKLINLAGNITGTLGISNGGSGQTSANNALNAFLPSQTGNANKVLSTDGSNTSWASAVSLTLTQYYTDIGDASNVRTATNTNLLGDVKAVTESATVTMTIAAPCVVTYTSHGLISGDKVYFTTTGALPTGVSASTTYWVTVVDTNSFKLSSSASNYNAQSFVTTTGSQSGTHTAFAGGLNLDDGRYYEGTFTATFTGGIPVSNVTINYRRVGKLVVLTMPTLSGTGTGSSASATSSSAVPAGIRPGATTYFHTNCVNNGTNFIGVGRVTTGGTIDFFRDPNETTAWGNTANSSTVVSVSYYMS